MIIKNILYENSMEERFILKTEHSFNFLIISSWGLNSFKFVVKATIKYFNFSRNFSNNIFSLSQISPILWISVWWQAAYSWLNLFAFNSLCTFYDKTLSTFSYSFSYISVNSLKISWFCVRSLEILWSL